MDIVKEIEFPVTDPEWIPKVLLGGLLGTIPIIGFFTWGYYMKALRTAIGGTPELPKWDDWGNLFISGLSVFIISVVYYLIPLIVAVISVGGIVITAITTGNVGLDIIGAAMGGFAFSFILLFVSSFLLPMALAMYAKEDSMGAAFRFGELLSRIKSELGDYIIVFIVVFILFSVLGMIASIPFLGFLIFIFGKFYIFVVAADMYGRVYAQSKA